MERAPRQSVIHRWGNRAQLWEQLSYMEDPTTGKLTIRWKITELPQGGIVPLPEIAAAEKGKEEHHFDDDEFERLINEWQPEILYSWEALHIKWPGVEFRINPDGTLRRKSGGYWQKFCWHGSWPRSCVACNKAAKCKHGIFLAGCLECNAVRKCPCGKRKQTCRECSPQSYCACCGVRKQFCKNNGSPTICKHNIRKQNCFRCGGSNICTVCRLCVRRAGSEYCRRCHPDYVASDGCSSKAACAYFDRLELAQGRKILHRHLDKAHKCWTGVEHRPDDWRKKPVDGYYVGDDGTLNAIEFHGELYHGHPTYWGDDEKNVDVQGRTYKSLFDKTERNMRKLKSLGYRVSYVWEYDVRKYGVAGNPENVLRVFEDTLEWQ